MISEFHRLRPTAAARAGNPRAPIVCAMGVCAAGVIAAAAGARAADDASRWDGDALSAVRLIAGTAPADKTAPLRAGVEIRLKPGWHTYWRYPGDAGVPPRFDFSASRNVTAVEVSWPAPRPMPEPGGLVVIGYASDVIFPLAVVPQDRGKPVTLRLKLDYAVCEKLCVPAEGKAELALSGARSTMEGALAAALAQVPKKQALGEGSTLAVRSLAREDAPPRPRIVVDVAAPAAASVALFAEGPTPDWALPVPAAIAGAPQGLRRFAFELDGAPPGADYRGAAVTLTAVAGDAAIEVTTRLD